MDSSWQVDVSTTKINLVVKQNGGTSVVTGAGGSPSGFMISLDGGLAAAPAATAIADSSHLTLTAKGAAQRTVSITYQAGAPGPGGGGLKTTKAEAGIDNAAYDNRGDATTGLPGYPLAPITGTDPLVLSH